MEINKQSQTAGDNSQQWQLGNVTNLTVVNGITEQRAREIFHEMNEIARRDYTSDAYEVALKRVTMFESLLMEKVQKVDGILEEFADPSFQYLLADAQRRAAASEREADYTTLTELLESRVKHKENRKIRAGISQAVRIVDEIDDDALCALTVYYFYKRIIPLAGICKDGLDCLEACAKKLLETNLPYGNTWLDHLELFNAIRRIYFTSQPKLEETLYRNLSGYICVGINKSSDIYTKAVDLLSKYELPANILVDHELLEGYVRIPVSCMDQLEKIRMDSGTSSIERQQISALSQIWSYYSKDKTLLEKVKKNFLSELQKRPTLNRIKMWWNSIPMEMEITQVGAVLAHANARRLDSSVPDFLE